MDWEGDDVLLAGAAPNVSWSFIRASKRRDDMLGIRKERIDPGEPWQDYAETLLYVMWNLNARENSLHNLHYVDLTLDSYGVSKIYEWQFHIISIQRRLADHAFSNTRTWPEIQQAHQTWWTNYNAEHHYAHRERQDGRHRRPFHFGG